MYQGPATAGKTLGREPFIHPANHRLVGLATALTDFRTLSAAAFRQKHG